MSKPLNDVYANHVSTPITAQPMRVALHEVERLRAAIANIKAKALIARGAK